MDAPLIIAALVIVAVWAVYLLPNVFGERGSTSMNSTEEFDRWSHSIAHVQKKSAADLAASHKDQIRTRRRRILVLLTFVAVACLGAGVYTGSMPWLLAGLFFTSLVVLYVVALAQMKQRRLQRLKVTHVAERPTEWEEPQVKVIAN